MRQEALKSNTAVAPWFWIVFGWGTHALFVVTVYYLFGYLKGPETPPSEFSAHAVIVDAALAIQFAVFHSLLLLPSVRDKLTKFVPNPAYGVFFCFCTCLSLLTTIHFWQPCGGAVWHLSGLPQLAVQTAFSGAWVALFYSLSLTGFGYQTGWTTWRPWTQGRTAPRREFQPRGAYLLFRHPVYLSFLGLVWLTPCMTFDRAVLTAFWTAYIFYGSFLKDRRLQYYLGDSYRIYQARVPGYPGIPAGPLAKVPLSSSPSRPASFAA